MPALRRRPLILVDALDAPQVGSHSQRVASLAAETGVSERTMWRWLKLLQTGQPAPINPDITGPLGLPSFTCQACGQLLPRGSTSRRRYCDARCRVHHHRHRNNPNPTPIWPRPKPHKHAPHHTTAPETRRTVDV